jgi:aspartate-semialdehyde dehydrogenase
MGVAASSIKEPVMMMRVSVAGATGAIGKQLAPRLAAGEVGAVLMTELRGASNAKAKRAGNKATGGLGWQPRHPSWRQGLAS